MFRRQIRHHRLAEQPDRALGVLQRDGVEIDLQRGVLEAADHLIIGLDLLDQLVRRADPGGALLDLGFARFLVEHVDDLVVALVVLGDRAAGPVGRRVDQRFEIKKEFMPSK